MFGTALFRRVGSVAACRDWWAVCIAALLVCLGRVGTASRCERRALHFIFVVLSFPVRCFSVLLPVILLVTLFRVCSRICILLFARF